MVVVGAILNNNAESDLASATKLVVFYLIIFILELLLIINRALFKGLIYT